MRVLTFFREFVTLQAYWGFYVVTALFVAQIAVTGISFYSFSLYIRAWQNDPDFAFTTAQVGFTFSANPIELAAEIIRYMRDLAQGWSLTAINFSFIFGIILVPLTPFIGRLVDRRGAKIVMLIGVPLVAISFFLRAFMTEVWHLWILQIILLLGQTGAFLGTGRLVGLWFQKNRGLIMGFTMAGNNAGGIVMAPLSAYLLATVGWRTMFLIFGSTLFVLNFVIIYFFVRDKVEDVADAARKAGREEELAEAEAALAARDAAQSGTAEEAGAGGAINEGWSWQDALRTRSFWLIAGAQFGAFISLFAVLNQLAKHLEIVGINIGTAGTALGLLGVFGLLGKFISGYAAEKMPVRKVFAFFLALQAVGVLVLLLVTSDAQVWLLFPFVALYGLGFGAMGALQPLILLETFGLVAYATILGVMQVLLTVVNAIAPAAIGVSVDTTGTYVQVFVATLAFLLLGILAIVFARPPSRAMAPIGAAEGASSEP